MNKKILIIIVSMLLLASGMFYYNKKGVIMDQITEINARHILVETEQQALEILNNIKNGKVSFEDSAKKESKCPSGKSGGDLGYFRKGMMVKEFENAAFSTEKDAISAPVKTDFGWHLIKVIDKK